MQRMPRWCWIYASIGAALFVVALTYVVLLPPQLLRVGAAYASKAVCSAAFVSGRDPAEVLRYDVQSFGNPMLRLVAVKQNSVSVDASFLHVIAPVTSVVRPGLGCAAVPDKDLARAFDQSAPLAPGPSRSTAPWPEGEGVDFRGHEGVMTILQDEALAGPGMRAIIVVKDGRIVAERYGPGIDATTPLLGWSMTKTVTAALVGTVIEAGRLQLNQDHLLSQWANDARATITVAQLMSMSSGLRFNEDYGDVSDVTQMLYLEPDMAAFAASALLVAPPGSSFNYSSGSTVILSRVWQDAINDRDAALAWPRKALFGPLGMNSAILETDAAGTFVGSSYLYATARDWARFGLFLMQGGVSNGQQILSRSFVEMMLTPSTTNPVYGNGMVWMAGPSSNQNATEDPAFGLPADALWMRGHDGQTVTLVPSAGVVVVRMGLTPSNLGYRPQRLVAALLAQLGAP